VNTLGRLSATALLLGAAGCSADRITTAEAPHVTFDAGAWSGGTLVLRSTAFRGADAAPTVTVGDDTLGMRPFGSDSVLVQLPDTNGWVQLWVHLSDGGGGPIGEVRVHGFAEMIRYPIGWFGPVLPWLGETGIGYANGRLSRLYLRTGYTVPLLPDSGADHLWCLDGPMPSVVPGMAVVSHYSGGRCGPLIALPLAGGTAVPDTGPTPPAGGKLDFGPALHLGPGRWLADLGDGLRFFTGSPSAGFVASSALVQSSDYGIPTGFAVSPRGDRVIVFPIWASAGVRVLDPTTLGVAFTLTGAPFVGGAAFSEDGDTLFVVAVRGHSDQLALLMVDAISGAVLAHTDLHLQTRDAFAVTPDPTRPLLYVAGSTVEVLDRNTLAPVARLRGHGGVGAGGCDDSSGWAVLGADRQLFYVCLRWSMTSFSVPYGFRIDLIR